MRFGEASGIIQAELHSALAAVDDEAVERCAELLLAADGVFVVGVGRSMLAAQAFAKRLNHLGVAAYCVGDINEPALTPHGVLLVASGSGESVVPVAIAKVAKHIGAPVIHVGSNPQSTLATLTDVFVRIPTRTKLGLPDEMPSRQPMSSLFEQALLVLGDAIALMVIERRGLQTADLWRRHANLE